MKTSEKRDAALKLLASTGIWRSNYAPPLLRLLWRLGFDVPPPHFGTFWGNALSNGTFFGIGWGVLMWLFGLYDPEMSLGLKFRVASGAGLIFGLAMASYYAYGKRKHNLPSWKELGSDV